MAEEVLSRENKKLRLLGRLEQFHHIRNKLRFYNSVASTAHYVLPSRVLETFGGLQAVTFAALKAVIRRQPIMGVSVLDESPTAASWVRLDTINLWEVTLFRTISVGQQFIEDEHQKPFERLGELPLWRVVVAGYQNQGTGSAEPGNKEILTTDVVFDVGFFYNHAMGDGLSGTAFHLDFLEALNALATDKPCISIKSVVEIPKLQLLPSLEAATHWPLTMAFICWEVFKAFILGNKDSKSWTGPPVMFSPNTPPKTCLLIMILDSATLSKISRRCRENKATITSLLTVLIARSLARAQCDSAWRFTGISNRQMVDHVSGVRLRCSTNDKKGYIAYRFIDWEVVRSCKAVIDAVAKSPANQIITMLKFLSDMEGYFRSKVGKTRDWAFEVSNVGLVEGGVDRDDAAKFQRIVFSQSANVAEAPYIFSMATVNGGDMTIALTWQEGVLEEEKAKKVLELLEVELRQMAIEADYRSNISNTWS